MIKTSCRRSSLDFDMTPTTSLILSLGLPCASSSIRAAFSDQLSPPHATSVARRKLSASMSPLSPLPLSPKSSVGCPSTIGTDCKPATTFILLGRRCFSILLAILFGRRWNPSRRNCFRFLFPLPAVSGSGPSSWIATESCQNSLSLPFSLESLFLSPFLSPSSGAASITSSALSNIRCKYSPISESLSRSDRKYIITGQRSFVLKTRVSLYRLPLTLCQISVELQRGEYTQEGIVRCFIIPGARPLRSDGSLKRNSSAMSVS
mmetsp:Transcript_40320/g.97376  ORF Transcript_40320/g.97376 Transcript_40320/m.97376 type:complete len:263 (-) Transcript_40320:1305-2093(-)